MRVGQVIGNVVLSRVHPSLVGTQFKIVLPLTFADLTPPSSEHEQPGTEENVEKSAVAFSLDADFPRKWGNELVVYDDCSAAVDECVAFSEGAEAAAAFHPNQKPVDAFAGAILDDIEIDATVVEALRALKKENK